MSAMEADSSGKLIGSRRSDLPPGHVHEVQAESQLELEFAGAVDEPVLVVVPTERRDLVQQVPVFRLLLDLGLQGHRRRALQLNSFECTLQSP